MAITRGKVIGSGGTTGSAAGTPSVRRGRLGARSAATRATFGTGASGATSEPLDGVGTSGSGSAMSGSGAASSWLTDSASSSARVSGASGGASDSDSGAVVVAAPGELDFGADLRIRNHRRRPVVSGSSDAMRCLRRATRLRQLLAPTRTRVSTKNRAPAATKSYYGESEHRP